MYKLFLVLIGLVCFWANSLAQPANLEELLQTIENNNASLASYRAYMKGEAYQYDLKNKLPDPQVSAYYLPFGEHAPGDYSEFEIAQRLELPSVYAARNDWIEAHKQRLDLNYRKLRQEVLLEAKQLGLDWIHLQKQGQLIRERVSQAEKVYQQMQTLFEKGQAGILDLNKAKITWLDQQFALEELASEESILQSELQALNGGRKLSAQLSAYPVSIISIDEDSLWEERTRQDAKLTLLQQEIKVAEEGLALERKKKLPEFTAGYNYQGVRGNNYWGLYGGLSLPLWRGKHQVELAETRLDYAGQRKMVTLHKLKGEFAKSLERYGLLNQKYIQYRQAMSGLNSAELLLKSYELGEISFMDYYREISFYRETENRMLEMERELQGLGATLLQHRL